MIFGIKTLGGLGNLMFEIAKGESWRAQGHKVYYTYVEENFQNMRDGYPGQRNPDLYKTMFPNFDWDANKLPEGLKLTPKLLTFGKEIDIEPVEGIEYVGYWQSEKNFLSKEFVRNLFQPSPMIREKISLFSEWSERATCSIHVRRTDYLKFSHIHAVPPMEYYEKAMWSLEPFKIEKYIIFSDDIPWCQENFKGSQFQFMDASEDVSLFLMGMTKHHIIANSSFSWWGAFLNETQDSVVIAPERWFSDPKLQALSNNVVPQRWIKY
jgi:hypothetical protein